MKIIAFRASEDIERLIKEVAKELGITTSEYLRKLVIEDLERRSIITEKINNNLKPRLNGGRDAGK